MKLTDYQISLKLF